MRRLLKEPSQSTLAKIAVEDDAMLTAFARGMGVPVDSLRALIEWHFGKGT